MLLLKGYMIHVQSYALLFAFELVDKTTHVHDTHIPFASQCFWKSIRVRGLWNNP